MLRFNKKTLEHPAMCGITIMGAPLSTDPKRILAEFDVDTTREYSLMFMFGPFDVNDETGTRNLEYLIEENILYVPGTGSTQIAHSLPIETLYHFFVLGEKKIMVLPGGLQILKRNHDKNWQNTVLLCAEIYKAYSIFKPDIVISWAAPSMYYQKLYEADKFIAKPLNVNCNNISLLDILINEVHTPDEVVCHAQAFDTLKFIPKLIDNKPCLITCLGYEELEFVSTIV